jgi:hypothetical protein
MTQDCCSEEALYVGRSEVEQDEPPVPQSEERRRVTHLSDHTCGGPFMTDRGGLRRVSVVATTVQGQRNTSAPKDIAPAAPLALDGGCEQFTRLQTAIDKVMNLIRLGEYRANLEEGVLFDAVVGDVRCLFIELEPARMVSLSPREQQIARMVAWAAPIRRSPALWRSACGRCPHTYGESLRSSLCRVVRKWCRTCWPTLMLPARSNAGTSR